MARLPSITEREKIRKHEHSYFLWSVVTRDEPRPIEERDIMRAYPSCLWEKKEKQNTDDTPCLFFTGGIGCMLRASSSTGMRRDTQAGARCCCARILLQAKHRSA